MLYSLFVFGVCFVLLDICPSGTQSRTPLTGGERLGGPLGRTWGWRSAPKSDPNPKLAGTGTPLKAAPAVGRVPQELRVRSEVLLFAWRCRPKDLLLQQTLADLQRLGRGG